jgi:hypothetical protein
MKKLLLVALVVVLGLGVVGMGRADVSRTCSGQLTFGGWSQQTAACPFTPAGGHLTVWGVGVVGGIATAYIVPLPPIISVSVSIETLGGTTLLSCSSMSNATTQCSRAAFGTSDRGDPLRCVVRGWSNLSHGRASIAYGCAGL